MSKTMRLLRSVLEEIGAVCGEDYEDGREVCEIATLQAGVYRRATPMLEARFALLGAWSDATHGDWLSATQMEALWGEPADERLRDIKTNLAAHERHWEGDAAARYPKSELCAFAASAYTSEHVYLHYAGEGEPQIVVYDANGETRYANLDEYLEAYLRDD